MTENIHGPTTAKNIYGPSLAKNIYGPPMTKNIAAQVAPNSTNLNSLINRGKTKVKPRIAMVLLCLRITSNKIFKKRNSMKSLVSIRFFTSKDPKLLTSDVVTILSELDKRCKGYLVKDSYKIWTEHSHTAYVY